MSWALLQGNVVQETTDIDPTGRFHPSFKWVPSGAEVKPGWIYTGKTFSPPPAAAQPAQRQFAFGGFVELFTPEEQSTIVGSDDPKVRLFLLRAAGASAIDLADVNTVAGLDYLVATGLLTQERRNEILAPALT